MRRIVLEEEEIARRVRALGTEITEAYPEGDLIVLGLLKGSFIFLSDLVREIHRPLQVDFVVAASWAWSYLTYQRGARLITGGDGSAPVRET